MILDDLSLTNKRQAAGIPFRSLLEKEVRRGFVPEVGADDLGENVAPEGPIWPLQELELLSEGVKMDSKLRVRVFDGGRQEMPDAVSALITIMNGNSEVVFRDERPSGTVFSLPFYDNTGDDYTIVAFRDGYEQAGFTPVKCSPNSPQTLDIMLLKKNGTYNFANAKWEVLNAWNDKAFALLTGGVDATTAQSRYSDLMEAAAPVLACFFNLTTAMAAISLPQGTPLDYFREMIWDASFAQDRFFAYADPTLYDQVRLAAFHGEFQREPGFALFHHGATDSYKQIQFGEANVQLTFHANDTKLINGIQCIKMEPDIDYYKDVLAHGLLEVAVNGISHTLTNPKQVYVLRWIAGRHAGISEFSPPYTIQ